MIGLSRTAFVGSTSTGMRVVQGDLPAWTRQLHTLPVADAEDEPLERAVNVPLLSGLRPHHDAYGNGGSSQIEGTTSTPSLLKSIRRTDNTISTSTIHRGASVSVRSCMRRRYRSCGIAWMR